MQKCKDCYYKYNNPDCNDCEIFDKELDVAKSADEKTKYYKCEMLNHGWCYKEYKPSVANLLLERKVYLNMIEV